MSADSSATTPAFQQVSPDNHGPWVVVTSCILILLTVLVVVTRFRVKFKSAPKVNMSDWFIVIAMLIAVPQTVCVVLACDYGLGRHRASLDESSFQSYVKSFYASEFLLVVSVAFAKASMTLLIVALEPPMAILRACYALLAVIALWALSGVFTLVFRCDSPRPPTFSTWKCINQHTLYVVMGIFNVLTDIAVIVLSYFLMRTVQLPAKSRWTVIGLFACRIIVPVATILSLTTLSPYFYASPPDKPWYSVTPTIWSQIMLNLSLITACIPSLKRFLTDLRDATIAVQISQAFEAAISQKGPSGTEYPTGPTVGLGPTLAGELGVKGQSGSLGTGGRKEEQHDIESLNYRYHHVPWYGHGNAQGRLSSKVHPFVPARATDRSTAGRSESMKGLTDNTSQRTVDFKVEYESRASEGSSSRPSLAQGGIVVQ